MTDDYRPRTDDHLVEPMYEALGDEDARGPEEPRSGGIIPLVAMLTGVVAIVFYLAYRTFA